MPGNSRKVGLAVRMDLIGIRKSARRLVGAAFLQRARTESHLRVLRKPKPPKQRLARGSTDVENNPSLF